MQIVMLVPELNNLGTRPQERSILGAVNLTDRTVYANEQHRYGFRLQQYGNANLLLSYYLP